MKTIRVKENSIFQKQTKTVRFNVLYLLPYFRNFKIFCSFIKKNLKKIKSKNKNLKSVLICLCHELFLSSLLSMHWHFSGVFSLYFRHFNTMRHLIGQVLKKKNVIFLMDLPPSNNVFLLYG